MLLDCRAVPAIISIQILYLTSYLLMSSESTVQLFLSPPEYAECCGGEDTRTRREASLNGSAITLSNYYPNFLWEFLDVLDTLANSLDDVIRFLTFNVDMKLVI